MTDIEPDPSEQEMHDALRGLGKRLTLLLGVLAIGLALGLHLGLSVLQQAAILESAWPQFATTQAYPENAFWVAAKRLQRLTNISAGIGAVLLLVYGLMDYAEGERVDVDAWLEEQGEGTDDG